MNERLVFILVILGFFMIIIGIILYFFKVIRSRDIGVPKKYANYLLILFILLEVIRYTYRKYLAIYSRRYLLNRFFLHYLHYQF